MISALHEALEDDPDSTALRSIRDQLPSAQWTSAVSDPNALDGSVWVWTLGTVAQQAWTCLAMVPGRRPDLMILSFVPDKDGSLATHEQSTA